MKSIKNNINKKYNLAKSIVSNPKKFVNNLAYGNFDNLPFSFREMLNKIGNENINSLEIIRQPISTLLTQLLNTLSGFTLLRRIKNTPYDNLFHLKLRINNKYDLEKESSPLLQNKKNVKHQEYLPISNVPNITIAEFINNCVNRVGLKKFNQYNGENNNCQVFILDLLHSNDINNAEYDNFIKQDVEFIFRNNPNPLFRQIMNATTDLGNRITMLEEGTGISKPHKNISKYEIKPYTYKQAKKYNVIVKPSDNPNKKIDVFDENMNKIASIGSSKHYDYPTYLEIDKNLAEERRRLYKLRNKNVNSNNSFYSSVLLW